jgi:hypothetical protein
MEEDERRGRGGGKGRGRGVTSPARKSARRRSLEETAFSLSLAAAPAADMAGGTCRVCQAGFDLKQVFGFAAAAAAAAAAAVVFCCMLLLLSAQLTDA